MVVQEALASGLRVAATDVGDLARRFGPENGVHISRGDDAASLGETLLEALASVQRDEPFDAKVQTIEASARALVDVYRSLVR